MATLVLIEVAAVQEVWGQLAPLPPPRERRSRYPGRKPLSDVDVLQASWMDAWAQCEYLSQVEVEAPD